ncbi:phospholipid carrier-dependent glycosyltransferase [Leucobacter sp. CSA1]|uniref:Polyprenol-phosphate-mannose--protein mannosyltransferase n=1 Tax=Leucobacter chromiisoli TaxID=2796471 RepID=A0A934QA94_9MICO|nr:phospholipid carrier-dependent glycosyltransferase [Leucobacter chromiisoli]
MLAIAAGLRFWALSRPDVLVFDELYYVRDAVSQLAHGYPTVWPDDDPAFDGARSRAFGDAASNAVHPPLGKWAIGLGILVFGADSGWGWRSAVALAGVATVAVTMRLGWLLSRSLVIACLAGLMLAVDGVHVTLSRVGLLDGLLTLFVAIGALLVWRDHEATTSRLRILAETGRPEPARTIGRTIGRPPGRPAGRLPARHALPLWRPWLLAAGLVFGAAAAVKWSGLYPLAFFLVFTVVRDLVVLRWIGAGRPIATTAMRALVAGVIALPAAALAYLASWAGWILNPGGWAREPGTPWPVALARYHASMLEWHGTLSAPHPYQSHPIGWPLGLEPTAMYKLRWPQGPSCPWAEGCVSGISPLPNVLVTWGGLAALLVLACAVVRACLRRGSRAVDAPLVAAGAFVLTGYLSGWLPWVLTLSRSAVFQFYTVVLTPFSAVALALVLGLLCGIAVRSPDGASAGLRLDGSAEALRGRRASVAIFSVAAVVLAVLFFPVWTGMPVASWFWQLHLWLPGWA